MTLIIHAGLCGPLLSASRRVLVPVVVGELLTGVALGKPGAGLCALAEWVGTSILIAGFAAGLIVAVEGGPHRLSDQVSGVASGFLVPVFFVVLVRASMSARWCGARASSSSRAR